MSRSPGESPAGPAGPLGGAGAARLDLNLLIALDALLAEESVTAAADRLGLSGPAMSRTLGRIRQALGDPVLVRAGRHMVPTPRALALRPRVRRVLDDARGLFTAEAEADPATLTRTFTLSAHDSSILAFGAALLGRARDEAPGVTLRFLAEGPGGPAPLRDGVIDLEVGVIDRQEPEIRVETLFQDRMVGVARAGHPLLTGTVTPRRYAAAGHLVDSRRGRLSGPVDEALAAHGLRRRVVGSVPTFAAALHVLGATDAVGCAPGRLGAPAVAALGLRTFEIPVDLPPLTVAMAWHPRHDADSGHRWLRGLVRDAVGEYGAPEAAPTPAQ
ncbi:LysR family transcriptional regulator [Streptomyces albireticuli]|uniref:LysR family transcriptional regulator n=1 Tax=Streptomyces albireticuli TaxID=1940 RepID=A0A2A2DBH4_9ACTN|nr:LysR family transcriptional regulator [Streptomyces albireticuli]MCD9143231.1 LysR family transcriptional regulator [Streptomyces albireticuli]MCD9163673.1 LysR family transcriptional regulator [Streptomyces albireticuli]MCD9191348.1 LysR family transcriptional regulator [Streptomyces albireticuli]PAU48831.1 LysR family transcriptional regulator [Streptomyces albireticuli]